MSHKFPRQLMDTNFKCTTSVYQTTMKNKLQSHGVSAALDVWKCRKRVVYEHRKLSTSCMISVLNSAYDSGKDKVSILQKIKLCLWCSEDHISNQYTLRKKGWKKGFPRYLQQNETIRATAGFVVSRKIQYLFWYSIVSENYLKSHITNFTI